MVICTCSVVVYRMCLLCRPRPREPLQVWDDDDSVWRDWECLTPLEVLRKQALFLVYFTCGLEKQTKKSDGLSCLSH